MPKFTALQDRVLDEAVNRLKNESWFSGVCTDQMARLTDAKIQEIGFDKAVEEIISDTAYWDEHKA